MIVCGEGAQKLMQRHKKTGEKYAPHLTDTLECGTHWWLQ
jgi:hypothetical protein